MAEEPAHVDWYLEVEETETDYTYSFPRQSSPRECVDVFLDNFNNGFRVEGEITTLTIQRYAFYDDERKIENREIDEYEISIESEDELTDANHLLSQLPREVVRASNSR